MNAGHQLPLVVGGNSPLLKRKGMKWNELWIGKMLVWILTQGWEPGANHITFLDLGLFV